jgi:hypothetical protein
MLPVMPNTMVFPLSNIISLRTVKLSFEVGILKSTLK